MATQNGENDRRIDYGPPASSGLMTHEAGWKPVVRKTMTSAPVR